MATSEQRNRCRCTYYVLFIHLCIRNNDHQIKHRASVEDKLNGANDAVDLASGHCCMGILVMMMLCIASVSALRVEQTGLLVWWLPAKDRLFELH